MEVKDLCNHYGPTSFNFVDEDGVLNTNAGIGMTLVHNTTERDALDVGPGHIAFTIGGTVWIKGTDGTWGEWS